MRNSIAQGLFGAILQLQPLPWDNSAVLTGRTRWCLNPFFSYQRDALLMLRLFRASGPQALDQVYLRSASIIPVEYQLGRKCKDRLVLHMFISTVLTFSPRVVRAFAWWGFSKSGTVGRGGGIYVRDTAAVFCTFKGYFVIFKHWRNPKGSQGARRGGWVQTLLTARPTFHKMGEIL